MPNFSAFEQAKAQTGVFNRNWDWTPVSDESVLNKRIQFLIDRSNQLQTKQKATSGLIDKYKNFHQEELWHSDVAHVPGDFDKTPSYNINNKIVVDNELANLFVGINAQRSGIPLPLLKAGAMAWTISKIPDALRGSPKTSSPFTEFKDWSLYDTGYSLAQSNKNITTNDIINSFSQSLDKGNNINKRSALEEALSQSKNIFSKAFAVSKQLPGEFVKNLEKDFTSIKTLPQQLGEELISRLPSYTISSSKRTVSPLPENTILPSRNPFLEIVEGKIRRGFREYSQGRQLPIEAHIPQFVEAVEQYPIFRKYPYLLPQLAILESSGGLNVTRAQNPLNWAARVQQAGLYTPQSWEESIRDAITAIGGDIEARPPTSPRYRQTLYYAPFRETENLETFAKTYEPENEAYYRNLLEGIRFFEGQ